jgi:hypothetical protein
VKYWVLAVKKFGSKDKGAIDKRFFLLLEAFVRRGKKPQAA